MSSPRPAGTYGGGKVVLAMPVICESVPYWDRVGPRYPYQLQRCASSASKSDPEVNNRSILAGCRNSVQSLLPVPGSPHEPHCVINICEWLPRWAKRPPSQPARPACPGRDDVSKLPKGIPRPDTISVMAGSARARACRSKSSGSW